MLITEATRLRHEGNTPSRRTTVTSSINEISKDQLVVRGEALLRPPPPQQQTFGQKFKDDVYGFPSTSDISYMA
jgi:hypothetical protein